MLKPSGSSHRGIKREIQLTCKTFNTEQVLRQEIVHLLLGFYIKERKVGKLVSMVKYLLTL